MEVKTYLQKIITENPTIEVMNEITRVLMQIKRPDLLIMFIKCYQYNSLMPVDILEKINDFILNNIKAISVTDFVNYAKIQDTIRYYKTSKFLLANQGDRALMPYILEYTKKVAYFNENFVEIFVLNASVDDLLVFAKKIHKNNYDGLFEDITKKIINVIVSFPNPEYIYDFIAIQNFPKESLIEKLIELKNSEYLYTCLENKLISNKDQRQRAIMTIVEERAPCYIYFCARNYDVTDAERILLTKAIIETNSILYMFKYINNVKNISDDLQKELKDKFNYLDLKSKKETQDLGKKFDLIINFINQFKELITKSDLIDLTNAIINTEDAIVIYLFANAISSLNVEKPADKLVEIIIELGNIEVLTKFKNIPYLVKEQKECINRVIAYKSNLELVRIKNL